VAADGVDHRRPALLLQRLPGSVQLGAIDDLGGTELAQVGRLLRPAGRGGNLMAEAREQRDRDAADAAARAGHQHRAVAGLDAVLLERDDGEHRGVAGGADRHRLARRERGWQGDQPVALQSRALAQATPARFADTPAVVDDLVARLPGRMARREHGAGAVDARHHRPGAHDRALVRDRQRVLVVERRVLDVHRDIALGQAGLVDAANRGAKAGVVLLEQQGIEHGPVSGCATRSR
jgi:hypothetical protein